MESRLGYAILFLGLYPKIHEAKIVFTQSRPVSAISIADICTNHTAAYAYHGEFQGRAPSQFVAALLEVWLAYRTACAGSCRLAYLPGSGLGFAQRFSGFTLPCLYNELNKNPKED